MLLFVDFNMYFSKIGNKFFVDNFQCDLILFLFLVVNGSNVYLHTNVLRTLDEAIYGEIVENVEYGALYFESRIIF